MLGPVLGAVLVPVGGPGFVARWFRCWLKVAFNIIYEFIQVFFTQVMITWPGESGSHRVGEGMLTSLLRFG